MSYFIIDNYDNMSYNRIERCNLRGEILKSKTRIFICMIVIILALILLSGCKESKYEKAGKEFLTWSNKDPRSWTETQKFYFDNFIIGV